MAEERKTTEVSTEEKKPFNWYYVVWAVCGFIVGIAVSMLLTYTSLNSAVKETTDNLQSSAIVEVADVEV